MDLIDRNKALDAVSCIGDEDTLTTIGHFMRILKALPSEEPDIVVCADCIHWICHDRRCGYWNHGVKPLDWCCHAERRTDD